MLKLNHKAVSSKNISDVLFPRLRIVLDRLLALDRKFVFPRAVPVGFLFGLTITFPHSPVRPVSDPVRATSGNDLAIAKGTHRLPFGIGFNALTACKCKSHVARPRLEAKK